MALHDVIRMPATQSDSPARRQTEAAPISAYLQMISVYHAPPASGLSRLGRMLVPYRYRSVVKAVATAAAMPLAMLQARRAVQRAGEPRLHLGCGGKRLPGWVNIDLFGSNADIFWDVRRRLPFPARSVAAIFEEGMLEWLTYLEVAAHFRDCYRVLRPGGVLRIGTANFQAWAESYVGDGRYIEELKPGRPTRLLAIAELVHRGREHSFWDLPTLTAVLQEAGFGTVEQMQPGVSAIVPAPDEERTPQPFFFVEAVK